MINSNSLCLEIQLRASLGWGWEDIAVKLIRDGQIRETDKPALRRYVLGLSSRVTKRYGT